ncbi:MAG TPA: PAS domain S-box protein [Ilumatobacter sp.]|nr:PAS domain S-box protein [Ilumatobacter sp.]
MRSAPDVYHQDVYHQLVEMSPDAIVVTQGGVTTFVNEAGLRLLRAERAEQVLGRPPAELFHPDFRHVVEAGMAVLEAGPISLPDGNGQLLTFDGEVVPVEIRALSYEVDGVLIAQAVCRDLTAAKAAEAALQASQARFDATARATGEVVWDWDLTTDLIWYNGNFERMFGWPPDEVEPTIDSWTSRLDPTIADEVIERLQGEIDGTAETWHSYYRFRRRDGSYADVLDRGIVLRDDRGVGVRMIGTMRDITDINRAEQRLREFTTELEQRVADRTAELRAVNDELESFCYSVSHDLRSPLRGIAGFTEILANDYRDALDGRGQGYLGRVLAATRRMGELIDDLLQLSRVSREEMHHVPVDLTALAREILGGLRHTEPARVVDTSVEDGLTVTGDPRLIRIAFENLLDNAWKFTVGTDPACIEVGRTLTDDGTPAFTVSDNGAGFDMRYANKLFAPFQRLHRADEFPGTGIGLATVQRIVNRHGGSITVTASPGEGATFVVALERGRR